MKQVTMYLKEIPSNYYNALIEQSYCLSPDKVYMISQLTLSQSGNTSASMLKYLFRLPTKNKTYEALITEQLFEGICKDIPFTTDEIVSQRVYEYLYGKDTIRVFVEDDGENILAIGPEENKEWQYEFQKYHV